MVEYRAAYYRDEASGWYCVQLLDFPAVISQGRTINSARRMMRDALRGMVHWYINDGDPLPRPNPRAHDRKAELVEPVQMQIRVLTGGRA